MEVIKVMKFRGEHSTISFTARTHDENLAKPGQTFISVCFCLVN